MELRTAQHILHRRPDKKNIYYIDDQIRKTKMLFLEKLTFGKTSACRYSVSRPYKEYSINLEHASAVAHNEKWNCSE